MNTARRIVKNSGASLLTQLSTPVSSFVIIYFIAQFLGVSGLGKFASALALLFIFQAFSSLGFQYLLTREIAQDKSKADKLLINASFLGGIFSIFMVGVMCLAVNFITDTADIIHASYILSISLIPYALALVFQSIIRGYEKLEYITISKITGDVFKVLLGSFVLLKGYGLAILMIVISLSYFLVFFVSVYFTLKCIPKKHLRIDLATCKWIIGATPIFALIFILSTIRWNIDTLILTKMMGEVEVGLYSAAFKLMNVLKLGISSYVMAIQPIIFRLFKSSNKKFEIVCRESMKYLLILSIPIALGTLLLSERFILLLFKPEFISAAYALQIIVWIITMAGHNLIFANILVASNHQKINLIGIFIGMIFNICLNLLLIPKLGFVGASITSILSAIILFIFQYYYVSKYIFKANYFRQSIKPIIASMFMVVSILLMKDINLFLIILISMIVYMLGLVALKTFSARDISLVKKLWKGEERDFYKT
jgi:O-antigen/teichoic acid export membrane protein